MPTGVPSLSLSLSLSLARASLSPAFVRDFEAAWRDLHAADGRRQLYQLTLRTVSAKGQVRVRVRRRGEEPSCNRPVSWSP